MRCGHKAGGVLTFIAHYYGYHSILFFDRTSGVLALVSAMFTVAWIQRHNEMTALMAAGVSRMRVLVPIIVAVAVVSLLLGGQSRTGDPRYRNELSRRPQDPLGDMPQGLSSRYDYQTDVVLRGKSTFADQMRIEEPNFLLPAALADYGKQVIADNAYYRAARREIAPADTGSRACGSRRTSTPVRRCRWTDKPVLITPRDAPRLAQARPVFRLQRRGFRSTHRRRGRPDVQRTVLDGPLDRRRCATRAWVTGPTSGWRSTRIVQPLLDMTLLFLGLPLVVTRESRNVFLAMGMCMAVTVAFTLTAMGLQKLGEIELLDPALAAWAPLMIFVPLAVTLAESLWK